MIESNSDHAYMCILNRGGLSIPCLALIESACRSFAILNFTENTIKKSTVPSRKAAEVVYIYKNIKHVKIIKVMDIYQSNCFLLSSKIS